MIENFTAIIGAKIKDFQRKMKMVDKKVKETATEATKPITADINDFYSSILEVESLTEKAVKKATKEINVDLNDFYIQMAEMNAETKVATKPAKKNIGANIADFMRKAAQVAVVARSIARDKVVVIFTASIKRYQAAMTKYASMTRALGEVMQNTFQGVGVMLSAGLVPVIAVLGGAIGNLGPMLGVVAGSTFALASAFAVAGIGAAAFGGLAVTNLKGVFKESQKAKDAMDRLKGSWADIAKETKAETVSIFIKVLNILNGALLDIKPMFMSVTDAVSRLTDSLGRAFDSKPMQAFFDYLNKSAGPLLETVTKGIGNFVQGLLNMMTAFAPLTDTTAKGFEAMGASFATWAAGLGESKKFQSFISYVQENMPKIRSIFSDAFQGIINVFAGFAPSSADMMTSLQDMMERFKEWSSTISQNQGFQNFISYIKENAPKVVSLIGNLTTFLVNLGIALAPLGSKILDMVNSFLAWSNSMLENHPIIGKIVAVLLVLTGGLIAIAPHIIAFGALFGGVATAIGTATALMRAKMMLSISMMIGSMIKAGAQMVITTATFVAKWAVIGLQAGLNAVKVAAAWTLTKGAAMASAVASMATAAAKFIAKWVLIGAQALVHAAKVAAAWTLSTGAAMARAVGFMIATSAVFVAKWVWMGVQSLLQAGRMAAAWFIALGPVGWVIGAIVGLAILVIANWDKIKSKTIEIWNKVSSAVKDAWEKVKSKTAEGVASLIRKISEIPGKVKAFRSKLLSAGADLIMGLIKGITGKAKDAINAITDVVGDMVGAAKKFLKIKSPSRVMMAIGDFVGQGLAKGVTGTAKQVASAGASLASKLTSAIANKTTSKSMKATLQGVKAYASQQISILEGIAKKRESVAIKLKAAQAKLVDAIKLRDDFAKSVTDDALDFASIGNIEAKTGEDLAKKLQDKLGAIRAFQENIKKLQKSGLNKDIIQEIISSGVESGGAKAALLAGSSGAVIMSINDTQAKINKVSKTLGKETADQFYGAGVMAAQGIAKGLQSQAKALELSANKISDALVKAVKRRLDIHSPSRVFAKIGAFVSKGLAIGIDRLAISPIKSIVDMANQMTNAFNPQLAMADMQANATLNTSVTRADMKAVQHSYATDIGDLDIEQSDTVLIMDGKEVGKITAKHVAEENNRHDKMVKVTKGGR
ncbi:hypothetical protein [Paenisporosarcina sp. OV554]|uniref:phage tail protein n=1 Tax=Paenisporosarcina sp. OV554 TaxID=2135694 RepID=UPI000D3A640C|nr:hypothetical protein [Paenisporosarcina sp. OV554]PUB12628.1 hypothetical protein C8K15_109127 [Paenisporosarcina sp. OV554]